MARLMKGIKGRLIVTYIILISLSFLLLGLVLTFPLEKYYLETIKQSMLTEAKLVRQILGEEIFFDSHGLDEFVEDLARDVETRITVVAKSGEVLADSQQSAEQMENHRFRPELRAAFEQGEVGTSIRYSTTVNSDMFYLAIPVVKEEQIIGAVRVALPLNNVQKTLNRVRDTIGISILIITAVAIIISIKLAASITRPMQELSSTAREIAKGNWSKKAFSSTDDEMGDLANSLNFMTDTLQEKIGELETSKGKLQTVINNMPSGILVLNPQGRLEMVNPSAKKLLNIEAAELEQRPAFQLFRHYGLNSIIEDVLKKKQRQRIELTVMYPTEKVLETDLIPVITKGKMTALIVVLFDITEIKVLGQMKTQFVANASHELRTPLTSIKGFAETLLNGAMEEPETREKFIRIIDAEADRLIRITDELLDLAKAEARRFVFEKTPIALKDVILDISESLNPRIKEKNLQVVLDIPRDLPKVTANRDALTRIIMNLFDNAIKYTEPGGKIGVRVVLRDTELQVNFWDSGVGIPYEDLSRVFERFYRVDKARSRHLGGTGLGLAIVKHLVEAHHGQVGVKSALGRGSTFWFTLPLNRK
ncbi:MAG: two-component system histidine kinase PnpS [Bacillota bacterium]